MRYWRSGSARQAGRRGWSAALVLAGPGTLSLDHVLGHRLNRSWMRNLALAAAVPAALAVIASRRRGQRSKARTVR